MEMDRGVRRSRAEAIRWIVDVEADLEEVEVIQAAAPGLCREGGVEREKRVADLVEGRERESGKSTEGLHWGLLSWLLAASLCGFLGHMQIYVLCMTMTSTSVETRVVPI
jgi:hypothetical protein